MRRIYFLFLCLILGISITVFFFSSVSLSGDQGDSFYTCMKNDNYDELICLLDKEALKEISKESWLKMLQSKSNELGDLLSYKNIGLHTETVNGLRISRLDYIVIYSNGMRNEKIEVIKRNFDFKILSYQFNDTDSLMYSMK